MMVGTIGTVANIVGGDMIPFPDKKYNIIYADPAWSFSSKELQKYSGKRFTPLNKHYSLMTKKDIEQLPVKNIAADDCALFLWTTDAHIPDAIELCSKWGFKYVTVGFVWEKRTKNNKLVSNLGAWTLKNYELCLFATRGKMLQYKKVNNIKQKVKAERTKHSKKPDIVRKNIELLFGDLPRIELFARETSDGWDSWGNEIG
jgi:site-specific DNA-methyltransferase (adenine-specific)